ncbi:hypothetical protein N2W54_003969 [Lotmaria passim]
MARRFSLCSASALAAAVLCVLVVAGSTPTCAAAAAASTTNDGGADAASAKYVPPPVPAFEKFFAQQFRVSVMTQSYGVFNATLRMRGSMNFPERVRGELIPLGEPRLNRHTQTLLPHFQRVRSVEDEKLSDLPFAAPGRSTASGEFASAAEEEHPSLLMVDLQLLHTDAAEGKAQVFYLPADLMALRSHRAAMGEGSVAPTALVDFSFRVEAPHMSNNPLSDTPALARVSAATVATGSQKAMEAVSAGEEAAAVVAKGEVIFRWITEHEFSAVFSVPMQTAESGKNGAAASHLEHIWVYGYAAPTPAIFDRKQRQVPWYNKYLMLGVALMGFVVQIISGWTEGKTRAMKASEQERLEKAREQTKLEAALKEQEKLKKKK